MVLQKLWIFQKTHKNLINLNILFLWDNELSGEIPPEIGNLTNLNTLVIGDNQFTGFIPEEICNINIE